MSLYNIIHETDPQYFPITGYTNDFCTVHRECPFERLKACLVTTISIAQKWSIFSPIVERYGENVVLKSQGLAYRRPTERIVKEIAFG